MSVQVGIQWFLDDVDPVILSRGQDYYRRGYKDMLIEDGRWEAEYPGFLAELKGKWSPYTYMDILAKELIQELRQAYPRRPALWDELGQVEREIKKP